VASVSKCLKEDKKQRTKEKDNVVSYFFAPDVSPRLFKRKSALTGEHRVQSVIYQHNQSEEHCCFPPRLCEKGFLSFRSFIPGCIHEDTPHSAFDALMNHEYLHIILTNVFRYDLHQSVNQMIRWSENVF
jgi:hypothetical protein